jgi:hypothetical protein
MAFRVNDAGDLIAFAGSGSTAITIDGKTSTFADQPFGQVAWAPVTESRRVPNGAVLQLIAYGAGTLRVPLGGLPPNLTVFAEGPTPGSKGAPVAASVQDGALVLAVSPELSGRWLYAVTGGA